MAEQYPDIDSLALFLATCEAGSISAAGRAGGLTQPAATARIRRLERRLGLVLLVRSTRGCTPTEAGGTVAAWAREVVGSADRLITGVKALQGEAASVALRVTASYTTAEYLLPQALIELRRSSPEIAVSLLVSNSSGVIDDVLGGRSQLGFIEGDTVPRGLRHRSVADDRLVVIAATDNPIGRGKPLKAEELVSCTLVLREPGSGTREVFIRALTASGAEMPASVIEIGSTAAIMHATAAGDAFGVVSELAMRGHDAGSLRTIQTPELELGRTLRAIWRPQHSRAVADVVAAAVRAGHRLNLSGDVR